MFRGNSKLGNWGVVVTILYFVAVAYFVFFTDYVDDQALSMNELGDFLAGVFGPPALVWVVISFYLQSDELRNSVKALNLQAEELKKSVEQQVAMVNLTRESITHEKVKYASDEDARRAVLQPNFKIDLHRSSAMMMSSKEYYQMHVRNIGGPATDTRFAYHGFFGSPNASDTASVWDRSERHTYEVSIEQQQFDTSESTIVISYRDSENTAGEQLFKIDFLGKCREITSL